MARLLKRQEETENRLARIEGALGIAYEPPAEPPPPEPSPEPDQQTPAPPRDKRQPSKAASGSPGSIASVS
jgi:hypothetical protein